MSDDGFHEIQLNGKQLVFLFMAATVVSVVIFLCGVMVGRGVHGDQAQTAPTELAVPAQSQTAATASAPPLSSSAPAAARTEPGSAPVPEPADDESDYKALTSDKPIDENLKSAAKHAPAPTPAAAEKTAAKAPPAAAAAPPSALTSGFAVQVTALRDRSDAEAIVKRLVAKGYQAYLLNPLPGKPPVYRVQVGRYQNRSEADRIAARLKKEEQFSPWVTR
jgi:DedD protein